jgi:ureidoacrylate peracid hydrolase
LAHRNTRGEADTDQPGPGKNRGNGCDMQNDFGSKRAMFDRDGFDISMIQRAVPPTAWISNRADNVGATVRLPNRKKGRILIRDTWNTDIVDELTQEPGDLVLYKHRQGSKS